jgi:hypothetical protein
MDQGITVHLATFHSPFFSAAAGREGAAMLGVPWRHMDFTPEIMALLENPPSGFGSRMNPCVDCHAAMFRVLWETARRDGFDFIFSGEVLGQRPMSQNRGSLNRVRNLSGAGGALLRPLSALLLEPTEVESGGLVDRSRLLGFSGRNRKPQIELAAKMGFERIPTPAGGCLLTDPGYSRRLRLLLDKGLCTPETARAVRAGRMFDLGNSVALVGRSEQDNRKLEEHPQGVVMRLHGVAGPLGLLIGEPDPENLTALARLMVLYSRAPGEIRAVTEDLGSFTVAAESRENAERMAVRLP